MKTKNTTKSERPPVIAIMGHIDHGKSTLLDHIRHTNITSNEAGGITQHIGAYEVIHKSKKITFLDTPGHAAFKGIRSRGANVADIAVLVVSGEEGVKPQTLEALQSIITANIPYIVAITKIDSPKADIERTKVNLAENEIYLEGYGGQISWMAISAKTGQGVTELLDLMLLQSELGEFAGDPSIAAQGVVIETNLDKRKGISATLIIKNGTLRNGMAVVCGQSIAPVRQMEDFMGKHITEASFSSPIKLIGFDVLPKVGETFYAYADKKIAMAAIENSKNIPNTDKPVSSGPTSSQNKNKTVLSQKTSQTLSQTDSGKNIASNNSSTKNATINLVIKADVSGSLEAIEGELKKIKIDGVSFKMIHAGIGDITESDVKTAASRSMSKKSSPGNGQPLINGANGVGADTTNGLIDANAANSENILLVGFNANIDAQAKSSAERMGIDIYTFDIIYKLIEWIEKIAQNMKPKIQVEEITGKAKILKVFSKNKDKQVLGGRVIDGVIIIGSEIRILRRESEIGQGRIRELQQQKEKTSEAKKDTEFGALIESKIEIAPGDQIQAVRMVTK